MLVCPICKKSEFVAVCSECYGQLQAENEQRDGVIESLEWDIDEYLKGTLEATLRAENKQLEKLIDDLWVGGFVYEDDIPEETPKEAYDWLYQYSKVDGVRLYPKILVHALKRFNDFYERRSG